MMQIHAIQSTVLKMNGQEVKSQVKVHITRFNLRELRLLLNVVIQLVGHPQEIKERMFSTQGFFFFFNPRELAQELLEE